MARPYRPSRTAVTSSAPHGGLPPGRHRHRDISLQIGASHLDVQPVEVRQDVRVRMAVPVVGADPDHADLGTDRLQERRFGGGRTVVRDREQLRLQPRCVAGQQIPLSGGLHVTGGQDPLVAEVEAQDVGAVVELAALVPVRTPRGRMQHLHPQVADRDLVAGDRGPHGDVAVGGDLVHLRGFRQVGRQRRRPHHAHVDTA